MEKIFNVIQTSNCDGEILVNVTPCADFETAKKVMDDEIDTLLSDGKYSGLDLDEIEKTVRIYAGLKTLIIERDTHCAMPQFRAMLEGTVY